MSNKRSTLVSVTLKRQETQQSLLRRFIKKFKKENHHVILFGINVKIGSSQKDIVVCCQKLENELKKKFSNYEINIKVSPIHRY